MSIAEREQAAHALGRQVANSRLFRVSRRIALYWANDGEIDPTVIFERALVLGKQVYLPVLSRVAHDRLWFAPASLDTQLRANRFGIPEPCVPAHALIRAQAIDVLFVPLVAFDAAGNRLGMGGGYYDRSLAFLALRQRWRKPHVVGLAYDFQRIPSMPANTWDVPLAAVATDCSWYNMVRQ